MHRAGIKFILNSGRLFIIRLTKFPFLKLRKHLTAVFLVINFRPFKVKIIPPILLLVIFERL